uniref:Uncharacterized protein n=1 Tax=Thuricola similis TaxID=2784598 RepID=A0A7T8G533_9CILI|nr:hypothetical protein K4Z05_mgp03 [Thuricola similis]QQP22160.1 hypothetical protein TSIM_54 [Thuricola similis]
MIIKTYEITVETINVLSSHEDINTFLDYVISENKAHELSMLHHDASGHLNKYNDLYGSATHLLDIINGVAVKSTTHLAHSFDITNNIFSARQATFNITTEKLTNFLNKITPIRMEAEELYNKIDHIHKLMHEKLEEADLRIESYNMSSGSSLRPSELQNHVDTSSDPQDNSVVDSYME